MSALANAEHNYDMNTDELVVKEHMQMKDQL